MLTIDINKLSTKAINKRNKIKIRGFFNKILISEKLILYDNKNICIVVIKLSCHKFHYC